VKSFPKFWQSVRTTFRIGLPVAVVLTCVLIALSFVKPLARPLAYIEERLIDYRMERAWDREAAEYPSIAIITISNEDLADYTDWSPTPRDYLARVIAALDELAPRAIGLDFFFMRAQTPERDRKLLDTLREAKAPIVLGAAQRVNLGRADDDPEADKLLAFQRSFIASSQRPAGFLSLHYDPDHVIRVASSSALDDWPNDSFAAVLAKMAGAENIPASFRVAWLRGADGQHAAFRVIGARTLLDAQTERGPEWAALGQSLKNRIILVGNIAPNMDQHRTPLGVITKSSESGTMIHAHLVAQLLDGRYFADAGPMLLFGLLLSRSLLGFFAGIRSRSRLAISIAVTGGAVGLLILDARMLDVSRTVIPITLLVIAWVLAFAAGSGFARGGLRVVV
jgi:CHASE2 domain-containing sensor protein